MVSAPPGFLPAGQLASVVAQRGGRRLWLQLGPQHRDPATLLLGLISEIQQLDEASGAALLEHMRRQPGPVAGWRALFMHLGGELADLLGSDGTLVLENYHILGDAPQTARLLAVHALAGLPAGVCCILTAERALPPLGLPEHLIRRDAGDLRVSRRAAEAFFEANECHLTPSCVQRIIAISEGRAEVVLGLYAATDYLGPASVQQAVMRAARLDDLLAWIASSWLAMGDTSRQQALALALHLGWVHPELLQHVAGQPALPSGPWLVPLEDDGWRLASLWHAPLRSALRGHGKPQRTLLADAAAYLGSAGCIEQAVPLYLEIGDRRAAARVIAESADELMSLGQWATLEEWLGQLPAQTLEEWPGLVYIGGELAAVQGQVEAAQRAFVLASRLFAASRDAGGACRSLLAESTLAAWRGDVARAETRARAANAIAEAEGMPWYRSWSAWQLGCLAVAADDLDQALAFFERTQAAAVATGDALLFELPRQAERLTLFQRELRQQREFHRRAYSSAEQAEQEAAEQLRMLLAGPPAELDLLLGAHGWSRLPLLFKLPSPWPPAELLEVAYPPSLWRRLLAAVGLPRRNAAAGVAEQQRNAAASFPNRAVLVTEPAMAEVHATAPVIGHGAVALELRPASPLLLERAVGTRVSPPIGELRTTASQLEPLLLRAYLLGPFQVTMNGHPIDAWPSGKARAVFKYLLARRTRPIARDVLMDAFWPDSLPEAARNSLNVTLHTLRQVFRAVDDRPVVMFEDGAYRLHPALGVWIDVEEFEQLVQLGRQLEQNGLLEAAAAKYEQAIALYRDDFLCDDPYEEWPVLARERLRAIYLEALDRLGQVHFGQGRYAACARFCQQALERDNCREDIHCRLMRCYARQGQHSLALRQYQSCVEALRAELEVEPSVATVELYERIRQREAV
jgi:DNA-binding SARP family transcriptional activator